MTPAERAALEAADDLLTEMNARGSTLIRAENSRRIVVVNGLREMLGRPKIIDLLAPENAGISMAEARRLSM
jgi:hypothetical protein